MREGHFPSTYVSVITVNTVPQQSISKRIEINFVTSLKTEIPQIDLFLLTLEETLSNHTEGWRMTYVKLLFSDQAPKTLAVKGR